MLQLMMQNVMIGTVDGDIYYVRNGRVPVRPAGFDYKRAMPGNTSQGRMAGHPHVRRPGADHQSAAGLHAELQRQPAVPDEGLPAASPRPSGRICSTASPASTSSTRPTTIRCTSGPRCASTCCTMAKRMTIEDAIEIAHEPGRLRRRRCGKQRLRKAWSGASAEAHGNKELAALYELDRQLEPPLRRRRHRRRRLSSIGRQPSAKTLNRPIAAGLPPPADMTDEMLLAKLRRGRHQAQGRLRPPRRALWRRVSRRPQGRQGNLAGQRRLGGPHRHAPGHQLRPDRRHQDSFSAAAAKPRRRSCC